MCMHCLAVSMSQRGCVSLIYLLPNLWATLWNCLFSDSCRLHVCLSLSRHSALRHHLLTPLKTHYCVLYPAVYSNIYYECNAIDSSAQAFVEPCRQTYIYSPAIRYI